MTSIFNISWEYPRMHVWCKFIDSSSNLWRIIVQTSKSLRTGGLTDRRRRRQYPFCLKGQGVKNDGMWIFIHDLISTNSLYGVRDPGQHWFNGGSLVWRQSNITWANTDLLSSYAVRFARGHDMKKVTVGTIFSCPTISIWPAELQRKQSPLNEVYLGRDQSNIRQK